MGAKQSNIMKNSRRQHELNKVVMDYLQDYDANRSSQGRRNKKRKQIELDSLRELLENSEAMEGLMEEIRKKFPLEDVSGSLFFRAINCLGSRAA